MTNEVNVQIVTFNNEGYIANCVAGIYNQSQKNMSFLFIDNASIDNTIIKIEEFPYEFKIIRNPTNIGFSAAHNQGFRSSDSKYVLVLNPDVFLSTTFVEELLNYLECDPKAGAACGKLLRLSLEGQPTDIIDSAGLIMHKNRRVFDRGQGEVDRGQYNKQEYIFGSSGAAVLYRREMLEDIKITIGITSPLGPKVTNVVKEEYFDESFFAYKEDIDLAWRAQLRGWQCAYVPSAVAYHARGWQPGKRKHIPRFIQTHSFKNRYLMILKNEVWQNLIRDFLHIMLFELASLLYVLFRTPYLIKGWIDVFRLLKPTLQKRKQIMTGKKHKHGRFGNG
ncbi:MAG: glycosyltransferase family 2 protein [Carboxydocellales bacterium]